MDKRTMNQRVARKFTAFTVMMDLSVNFVKKQVVSYFAEFFQIFWKIVQEFEELGAIDAEKRGKLLASDV